jgi:3'-phosphoadenosine 5'-phosphosulfate sulfotransferase (PAPS reductase)/FAD synthetase
VPIVKIKDVENYVRQKTGMEYVATGERANESVERNAQFKQHGGVDHKRKRFYPCCWWRAQDIFSYMTLHDIPIPPDYKINAKRSIGDLWVDNMVGIKERFPADFAKIREVFPLIDVQILRCSS